jgi:putative phosphoribosyl transferase
MRVAQKAYAKRIILMVFANRKEAGELLAQRLAETLEVKLLPPGPLVLAIPRGGVPTAYEVWKRLGGDLDVVLVHKIGAPDNSEFAVGSVAESGELYIGKEPEELGIGRRYIESRALVEAERLRKRRREQLPDVDVIPRCSRLVIVVDDGIATGSTMVAAVRACRQEGANIIIAAAPVASGEALLRVGAEADQVVVLEEPADFYAVGQFYEEFDQVGDEEVKSLLISARGKGGSDRRQSRLRSR